MTYPPQPPPEWNQPSGSPFGSNNPFGQAPQWPAYGQQPPTWSGYGEAPPADAPPPKRNNTGWIIGTVAGVLVVALLLGGLLWKLNYGDKNDTKNTADSTTTSSVTKSAPSTTKTTTSSVAPSAPPKAAPAGCEGRTAAPGPQTPAGWSTVTTRGDSPMTYPQTGPSRNAAPLSAGKNLALMDRSATARCEC
ncbi:Uncharacterised protein [Mycolicibacterium fortuitum]|uniref:Uncharacterized protein n=1 Tax=Mycolicibacterium fortuitum TaxID=1766 RepID=A0A378V2J1_MYCFO|nr:Uncharacterised protein [Mycolicibacterium fortuitum]